LGNDGKGANLLFCKLVCGSVGAYVICTDINVITNVEGQRNHVALVGVVSHGFLGLLHLLTKELVILVEVDCVMSSL
jgi:hypothetical protein